MRWTWRSAQDGVSLLELLISLSILSTLFVSIGLKIRSMSQTMNDTAQLMALDALEASISDFMRSDGVIRHSIRQAAPPDLQACYLKGQLCQHAQTFALPLFREGQTQAFTGESIYYDRNASPCSGPCPGYQIKTSVSPQCQRGISCSGPAYTLVIAEIMATGRQKAVRRIVQEIEKYAAGKFPGLQLQCAASDSVIYGIGLQGEALCAAREAIVLKGSDAKPVEENIMVTPGDCSSRNLKPEDQHFVAAIDAAGTISCAARFW